MTVRQLIVSILGHAADGRKLDDEVLVKVGSEFRKVDATYSDGTYMLLAGAPVN